MKNMGDKEKRNLQNPRAGEKTNRTSKNAAAILLLKKKEDEELCNKNKVYKELIIK